MPGMGLTVVNIHGVGVLENYVHCGVEFEPVNGVAGHGVRVVLDGKYVVEEAIGGRRKCCPSPEGFAAAITAETTTVPNCKLPPTAITIRLHPSADRKPPPPPLQAFADPTSRYFDLKLPGSGYYDTLILKGNVADLIKVGLLEEFKEFKMRNSLCNSKVHMEKMIRTQKQLSLVCTYLWFADQHPLALGIKSSHLSYSKQRVYESDLLEDQPTEEMKVVAICALQNLVMYSRSNKRTLLQAAMFIKLLFSNNTIQEYASGETVRAITAALEKDLWATGAVNEEYLKALNSLFGNFSRLRATEPATLSIPHLVTALKTGTEAIQEAALDFIFNLVLCANQDTISFWISFSIWYYVHCILVHLAYH
nr:protein CELLULOSE SYNTHASE INTERACTIVE 1-like [Ipomoea batatas]